jgi:ribose 5-phosphate isomerase B
MQTLLIASDHAGFELKEKLKKKASSLGIEFEDLGTHSLESVDYPDFANRLTNELVKRPAGSLGVLICGSGIGVSIAANRHPHIRAVLAESTEAAKLGREHNHANVLCIGARLVSEEKALEILKTFINTQPDPGERHVRRVQKLG